MKRYLMSTFMFVLCLGLGISGVLYAQGAADTSKGSVSVEVQDASGAIVQNATVILAGSTGTQKAASDVRGQAVFYNLIPGIYAVKVEMQGFRAFEARQVAVSATGRTPVQVRLEPGSVTEVVQVSERAITVDTSSTTTGANITSDTIANIPVGRNISALFSMAPGAAPSGGAVTGPGSANPSISGASGLENQYIIDGINATDQGYGAFGVYSNVYGSMGSGVNFDFVKEIQVKSGGFEAQYGQALGGVINVVTHSGTNEVHGALYAYTSPVWAEGTFKQVNDLRVSAPLSETHGRSAFDFGANVGGPLIRNKLFWYGSFNPSFISRDREAPKGYALRDLGVLPWDTHSYNWVGKLNYEIAANHHIEGTAFADPSRDPIGAHRTLVRNDLDANSSNLYGTRNWAVKYNGLFGANTLVNAQFAWNHTYMVETPEKNLYQVRDYSKPTATGAYTYTGGVGFMENSDSNNRQYNFMITRNLGMGPLGSHQIDLGYGFNQVRYDALHTYSGPTWTVPEANGVPAEDVGKTVFGGQFYLYPTRSIGGTTYSNVYRNIRGNFSPNPPTVATATDYDSAFIQDAWQINRYITAKLGVRWEEQKINGNLNKYTFAGNWAPRLGFIIDPTGSRKTKLFANWGRFYEKIPQDLAVRAMSEESAYNLGYSFSLPPTTATVVPGSSWLPYGTSPTVIYGGTKSQYQEEIVAGVEREFGQGFVVSARFIHRDLKRMIEDISGVTVEANAAGVPQQFVLTNPSASLDIFHNPVECSGGPNCDTADYDPGYTFDSGTLGSDGIPDTFPNPRRMYKAMELTAEKRFANNWSIYATYRLAKLFGNYEGLFRNDNGQSDPNITSLFDFIWSPALGDQFKVGPLPTDRRQIANLYGNYLVKRKLNLGFGWNVMSGVPLSKLMAHPAYGNSGEVPVGGRGAFGRSPTQTYFDARAEYTLAVRGDRQKLKLSSDLFNVFNRKTADEIDQNAELAAGDPSKDWLTAYSYHRPFYARFSLRFEF